MSARGSSGAAAAATPPVPPSTPGRAAAEVAHAFKPNVASREQRYVLLRDAIVGSDGATERRTPLSAIRRIRIYAVPSGMGPSLRRTLLSLRSGRKLVLESNSYVRFGVIEDRGETYRRLVEAPVRQVATTDPAVEIVVGPPTALWAFWLVVLIASAMVLVAGALVAVTGDFPLSAALYLGLVVVLMPLGWRFVAAGRARRADPMQLPDKLFVAE
ncbi:MAG: hypothetical protein ABI886_10915 [Betaproteobacteria bacterium]